jgi:hypothetical protein
MDLPEAKAHAFQEIGLCQKGIIQRFLRYAELPGSLCQELFSGNTVVSYFFGDAIS